MTRARLLIAAALLALAAGSTSLSSGAFTATSANPNSTFTADASFPSSCTPGTASVVADFDKGIRSTGTAPGANDTTLTVGTSSTGGGDVLFRALVHFPMPTLPTGCTLDTATLRMQLTASNSLGRILNMHQVTASWTESATWPGPAFSSTALASATVAIGQLSWNVKPTVEAVYAGGANNGFLVKDSVDPTIQSGNKTHTLASSEAATASQRPTLVVTYK